MLENWFYKMKPYIIYLFLTYAGFTLALVDISFEASLALAPLVFFAYLGGMKYTEPLKVVLYIYKEDEDAADPDFVCRLIEGAENQPVELIVFTAEDFKMYVEEEGDDIF